MVDGKWNKFRDDVTHDGRKIDWGKWAITGNDPVFGGTGNPDTGAYHNQLQPVHIHAIAWALCRKGLRVLASAVHEAFGSMQTCMLPCRLYHLQLPSKSVHQPAWHVLYKNR
jgi:hypothetical protein